MRIFQPSGLIEAIGMLFMLVAATNFSLHFLVWHRGYGGRVYFAGSQNSSSISALILGTLALTVSLHPVF